MMGMWYTYLWMMGHEIMGKKKVGVDNRTRRFGYERWGAKAISIWLARWCQISNPWIVQQYVSFTCVYIYNMCVYIIFILYCIDRTNIKHGDLPLTKLAWLLRFQTRHWRHLCFLLIQMRWWCNMTRTPVGQGLVGGGGTFWNSARHWKHSTVNN